jgi:hypothetical protein
VMLAAVVDTAPHMTAQSDNGRGATPWAVGVPRVPLLERRRMGKQPSVGVGESVADVAQCRGKGVGRGRVGQRRGDGKQADVFVGIRFLNNAKEISLASWRISRWRSHQRVVRVNQSPAAVDDDHPRRLMRPRRAQPIVVRPQMCGAIDAGAAKRWWLAGHARGSAASSSQR